MKLLAIAAAAALGIATSGCATIVKGTTQSLSIKTPPVEDAKCTLTNTEGTWYLTSPGSVVVHKTKNDLHVACTKDGFDDVSATVPSHFNGTTFGNIIAGGVIGVGIDAASGANYYYPPVWELPMTPVTPPSPVAQPIPDSSDHKSNS